MPDAQPRPEPFTARTAPAALADLRARLRATRYPDQPADAGWSLGTDTAYLRDLVAYWADEFDWPAQEAALNQLPRFRVPLTAPGGTLSIHFIHARAATSPGPVLPRTASTRACPSSPATRPISRPRSAPISRPARKKSGAMVPLFFRDHADGRDNSKIGWRRGAVR